MDNDININGEEFFRKHCPDSIYSPAILPSANRVIAIGDLHGDLISTIECLNKAGLIKVGSTKINEIKQLLSDDNIVESNKKIEEILNNVGWLGGDTVVVQVGDQVDRCRPMEYKCDDPRATINDEASDILILNFFNELHKKAIRKKGAVYSLLGNHELLNVEGKLGYVSYKGLKQFEDYVDPENKDREFFNGTEARKYAFRPGGQYATFMACTRHSAIIIGNLLFVHAGMVNDFIDEFKIEGRNDIEKINMAVRKWLVGITQKEEIADIIGNSKNSFFWNRYQGNLEPGLNINDPQCQNNLGKVLDVLKINNIIIGHTPQFHINKEGINDTCSGTIIRVDNGPSGAFDKFDQNYIKSNHQSVDNNREEQVLEILKKGDEMIFNII